MTRTRALSLSLILQLSVLAGLVALLLVAHASATPAAPAEPCDPASAQCCACGPSEAAEPAPLLHLYLPAVMHGVRMSSEYTPFQPTPTPEPDVELPLGDASQ